MRSTTLEVIALYLGHSRPIKTHAYIEADLMKADCVRRLTAPKIPKDTPRDEQSRLLAFLEAVRQPDITKQAERRRLLDVNVVALDHVGVIGRSG